jgi:hypothetical protein
VNAPLWSLQELINHECNGHCPRRAMNSEWPSGLVFSGRL